MGCAPAGLPDREAAVAAARRALELLPEDSLAERGFAMIILGGAMQMTGDTRGALDTIYAAMPDESSAANRPTFVTRLLAALCFVRWMDGDLRGLQPSANELATRRSAAGLLEVSTIAEHFLAALDYHRNRLEAVVERLAGVARSDVVISAEFHANNMIIAGLAYQERGETQQAMDLYLRAENGWQALVGIPLDAAPGTHHVQAVNATGKSVHIAFEVNKRDYETQHITIKDKRKVNPEKRDMERIGREQKKIRAALAHWSDIDSVGLRFLKPVQGPYSSPFGLRRFFNEQPRKPHSGIDIAAPEGTPIMAPDRRSGSMSCNTRRTISIPLSSSP